MKKDETVIAEGLQVVYSGNHRVYTVTKLTNKFIWLDGGHRFTLAHFAALLKKGTYYEYVRH